MNDLVQLPVRFGAGDTRMGMLTLAQRDGSAPLRVACLMLNMGANHRVGPRRINVRLAHALAGHGMVSLRLDLGGIGDSDTDPASAALPLGTRAVADLQAAMDLVQARLDIRRFVIVGMCSGVAHAMTTALTDTRVVGLSLFDGYAFAQWRARWERQLRRLWAAPAHPAFVGKLRRWLERQLMRVLAPGRMGVPLPGFFGEELPRRELAAWFGATLARLAERQVALHFLYSASLQPTDRGRDLLGPFRHEAFARNARYEFLSELDHTFCTEQGQRRYVQAVSEWALECAGAAIDVRSAANDAQTADALPASLQAAFHAVGPTGLQGAGPLPLSGAWAPHGG